MRLSVCLWGFGFAYGTDESKIYVNRFEFRPRLLTEVQDRWEPPVANLFATDTVTLEAALRWIGRYELQVERELGYRYRQELILKWGKAGKLDRPLNECWSLLAEELAGARNIRHLCAEEGAFAPRWAFSPVPRSRS